MFGHEVDHPFHALQVVRRHLAAHIAEEAGGFEGVVRGGHHRQAAGEGLVAQLLDARVGQ
jgi:hypothetical protein